MEIPFEFQTITMEGVSVEETSEVASGILIKYYRMSFIYLLAMATVSLWEREMFR